MNGPVKFSIAVIVATALLFINLGNIYTAYLNLTEKTHNILTVQCPQGSFAIEARIVWTRSTMTPQYVEPWSPVGVFILDLMYPTARTHAQASVKYVYTGATNKRIVMRNTTEPDFVPAGDSVFLESSPDVDRDGRLTDRTMLEVPASVMAEDFSEIRMCILSHSKTLKRSFEIQGMGGGYSGIFGLYSAKNAVHRRNPGNLMALDTRTFVCGDKRIYNYVAPNLVYRFVKFKDDWYSIPSFGEGPAYQRSLAGMVYEKDDIRVNKSDTMGPDCRNVEGRTLPEYIDQLTASDPVASPW